MTKFGPINPDTDMETRLELVRDALQGFDVSAPDATLLLSTFIYQLQWCRDQLDPAGRMELFNHTGRVGADVPPNLAKLLEA